MGVSICKPQSALLSDKQTSQPLPTLPSWEVVMHNKQHFQHFCDRLVTGWKMVCGAIRCCYRKEARREIITEGHSNHHHHKSPPVYNIFNCHDHKMSKPDQLCIVQQTWVRSLAPPLSIGVTPKLGLGLGLGTCWASLSL